VLANRVSISEAKFEMLRLIEHVQIIDAPPSKYGSSYPYRADASCTADRDWSVEDKRHSWSHRNDAWTPIRHRKVESFAIRDLKRSSHSMTDFVCWRLSGILDLDFDHESHSAVISSNPAPFYADVSPQLAFGTLPEMNELTFTSVPQFVGGTIQNVSKTARSLSYRTR
jgi:hypothetical protein